MSAHVTLPDGTVWPDPADPTGVQWRLRYGQPTTDDRMVAASAMAAYADLIAKPVARRAEIIRWLKGRKP